MADGTRKVTHISEVIPEIDEQGRYVIKDIFAFVQRGKTQDGKIVGEMVATGYVPTFMNEIELNRLPFGRDKFVAPDWYQQMMQARKLSAA
jgi:pilus assembly protein CpaF